MPRKTFLLFILWYRIIIHSRWQIFLITLWYFIQAYKTQNKSIHQINGISTDVSSTVSVFRGLNLTYECDLCYQTMFSRARLCKTCSTEQPFAYRGQEEACLSTYSCFFWLETMETAGWGGDTSVVPVTRWLHNTHLQRKGNKWLNDITGNMT